MVIRILMADSCVFSFSSHMQSLLYSLASGTLSPVVTSENKALSLEISQMLFNTKPALHALSLS